MRLLNLLFTSILTGICCLIGNAQTVEFTEMSGPYAFYYAYTGLSVFGIGVSVYDFDLDGYDDITFGGSDTEDPHFFRSTGTGIEEVTISGLGLLNSSVETLLWVDIDNDGDMDLSANNTYAPNKLFVNSGGLTMTDISSDVEDMTSTTMYSYAGAWGDYDRDGYLDFYCPNRDVTQIFNSQNKLYHNNGNNTFSEVGVTAGADDPQIAFGTVFTDFNKDGWPDIYTANDKDFTNNTLLENQGDGTFLSVADPSNMGKPMDGMGIAPADFDSDGYEDYYVTNTEQSSTDFGGNLFCNNHEGQFFTEIGDSLDVRIFAFGWGCVWADFDNDGHEDLYVSNSSSVAGNSIFKRNRLYMNQGDGTLEEDSTTNIASTYDDSFGCAVGDLNNDGYPDIVQANTTPYNFKIWMNDGGANNWIKIILEGTESNRMGVGSWIETYYNGNVSYRYTRCGTSYGSQNGRASMIGLGMASEVDSIVLTWPSGQTDVRYDLAINETHHFIEPSIITNKESLPDLYPTLTCTPNPSSSIVSVTSSALIDFLFIKTADGRKVYEAPFNPNSSFSRQINLTGIPPGLYFINAISATNQLLYGRLIVNPN